MIASSAVAKRDADRGDERRLGAAQTHRRPNQAGDDEQPHRDEADQKGGEPHAGPRQLPGGEVAPRRDGRQDGQQENRDQVLDDEDPEHDVGHLAGDLLLLEGLQR